MTFKILTFSFDISRILLHSKPIFIFDLVDFTDFHFQHPSLQLHNSPQHYKPFLLPILYRFLPSWKNFLSENQSKPHLTPTKFSFLLFKSLLISQHNTISFGKRKNFAYILNMLELQHSVSQFLRILTQNSDRVPKITLNHTLQKFFQNFQKFLQKPLDFPIPKE